MKRNMNKRKTKEMTKKVLAFTSASLLILSSLLSPATATVSQASLPLEIVNFPLNLSSTQSKTITIPDLVRVESVTTNTGEVEFTTNGEQVTIRVSEGTPSGNQLNPTKYSKEASQIKTSTVNSFSATAPYSDAEGYKGDLTASGSPTVISGAYIPGDSKVVSESRTSSTNSFQASIPYSSGGYSGTLSKSGSATSTVVSGSYTPADTKFVTAQTSPTYNSGGYTGTLTQYVYSGSYTPSDSKTVSVTQSATSKCDWMSTSATSVSWTAGGGWRIDPATIYYNSGGYTGTLPWTSEEHVTCSSVKPKYSAPVGTHYYADTDATVTYSGTVIKPAVDTRIYRYQGNVTKPAVDTRIYSYTQTYSGTVSKPPSDTRIWEQNYSGTVYKSGYDDLYSYEVVIKYTTDDTAPNAPILTADKVQPTNGNVEVSASFPDDSSVRQIRVNDDSWSVYENPILFSENGYVEARAIDESGNISEVTRYSVSNIDRIAPGKPVLTADITNLTNSNVNVAVSFSHDSTIKEVRKDNGEWMSYTLPIKFESNGKLEARSRDEAGNYSAIETYVVSNIEKLKPLYTVKEEILKLIQEERFDILSTKYGMSKVAYDSLVQTYYANKYTGDSMFRMAGEKFTFVPTSDQHYSLVKEEYDSLELTYYEFVLDRIQSDAEIKAEISVKSMEEKYDPSLAINAQTLVNAVEDASIRTALQARLDSAKAKYEASQLDKADQTAISAVEKAESTKLSYYISDAYKKVNLLTNETLKAELTTRLQNLETLMAYEKQLADATRSVEYAEKYKSDFYLSSAQKKVTVLSESLEKTALQLRLDNLRAGQQTTDQATIIKKATDYVSLAESIKSQYYVDKAQSYIDQITDETKKAEFQTRLNAVMVK